MKHTPKKYTYIIVAGGIIKAKVNTRAMADRIAKCYGGTVVIYRVDRLFSRSGKVIDQNVMRAACLEALNLWSRREATVAADMA